jgi:hypothetical protein
MQLMASPKFRIGQVVDFRPSPGNGTPVSALEYKILRLLPLESGERLYRIKTITEPYERIARESELVHGA